MKNLKNIVCGILMSGVMAITCMACGSTKTVVNTTEDTTIATESETVSEIESVSETETASETESVSETEAETTTEETIVAEAKKTSKEVSSPKTIKKNSAKNVSAATKSNEEIAKEVVYGSWGNGEVRKSRLTKAGYNYSDVQAIVNKIVAGKMNGKNTAKKAETKSEKKAEKKASTTETKAEEVKPAETTVVTEATETTTTTTTTVVETEEKSETSTSTDATETETKALKSNEEIAQEVIDGKWDNNEARKQKLTEAGYDYAAIQKIVNEKMKEINKKKAEETGTTVSTSNGGTTFIGSFKGTYYAYGGPRHGGSGRNLIDCSYGDGNVKGSIACRAIYSQYGYNRNGRTMVYLEVPCYPQMNGCYYVDDCCGSYSVIDFFYLYNSNCPFQYAGVTSVNCYIVN